MANIIVNILAFGTAPYRAVVYHSVLYDYAILKDYTNILRTERMDSTSLRHYDKYDAAERLGHRSYSIIIALRSGYGKARDNIPT
jgi:hypothetical protein